MGHLWIVLGLMVLLAGTAAAENTGEWQASSLFLEFRGTRVSGIIYGIAWVKTSIQGDRSFYKTTPELLNTLPLSETVTAHTPLSVILKLTLKGNLEKRLMSDLQIFTSLRPSVMLMRSYTTSLPVLLPFSLLTQFSWHCTIYFRLFYHFCILGILALCISMKSVR